MQVAARNGMRWFVPAALELGGLAAGTGDGLAAYTFGRNLGILC